MNKKIKKYVEGYKKLVDMPYNLLNLNNYLDKIYQAYKVNPMFLNTSGNRPIKLMSNYDENAGIITDLDHEQTKKRTIYIVGKGILFDSGGYDLKEDSYGMKTDMAGMACAIGVYAYFDRETNSDNVIPYCPVTTNFIHNSKIIPGDYLKIGKKTVEVTNTDAEGRLILAEALALLPVKENDIVITVATLTGCVEYAIGKKATGVFSPNEFLANSYLKASLQTKELAWRLPLWNYIQKKYNKRIIKNSINDISAGATEGAMFVKQFVKYPKNWIHLDIASSAYNGTKKKPTGEPLHTLIKFVEGVLKCKQ